MNNEEKKIQIELDNQLKNLNAINSKKPIKEDRKPISSPIPRYISLNHVPIQGLNIPILEKDLLSRLSFYGELLSEVDIILSKSFSGNVNLGEVFRELYTQIKKHRFKIIKASRERR